MNRFEELIKSVSATPSVIVHLGAGSCGEHETYRALKSDRIIYVEPDQYLAETATETFAGTSHVKVIPSAIAAENGQQILNVTNNRRFSSLLLPGELLDYYPNIKVDYQTEVEAITLTELCQLEQISKDSDNLLVAEIQGIEKEVFPSTDIDTLQIFKWIIIRSSVLNLYTPVSDKTQRSLSEVILDAGFLMLAFEEDTPPFVNFLCIRNDSAIDNIQLTSQKADLIDTIRILEHNLSKQLARLNNLQASHQAAITELQVSLTSRSEELHNTQTLLQSITAKREYLLKKVNELSSTVDARSDKLAQAHKETQSLTKEKEDLQQKGNELSSTLDARSNELARAHKKTQSLTKEKEDLQQKGNELSSTFDARSNELARAHKKTQSLTKEKEDLQQKSSELSSTLDGRSNELAQAQAQVLTLKTENTNQMQRVKELADSVKTKEKELTDMQQTLRINNKLILKSDIDLRDLQLQYRAALQHQEQQHTLLCELKAKLRQASEFYQKLNLQNLVLDADLLEQSNSDTEESNGDNED